MVGALRLGQSGRADVGHRVGGRGRRALDCEPGAAVDLDRTVARPDDLRQHEAQYLAIRETERLAPEQTVTSVGSNGDRYDNATAESIIGLSKVELLTLGGRWRTAQNVELATLVWVDWFNHRRVMSPIRRPASRRSRRSRSRP